MPKTRVTVVLQDRRGNVSHASLPNRTGAVCERLSAYGYTILSSTPIREK